MSLPIKTKEHLIYLMQSGVMRLSRHDLRFIQNLQNITLNKHTVTTNQVALFEKLVYKYTKQLTKQGYKTEFLNSLPWESMIIDSDPKFTEAYINIVDNKIIFKSPFHKKFVEKINQEIFKSFVWVKDQKIYISDFSVHALKFIVELAKTYYSQINYCEVTKTIINKLQENNAKYWSPTLVMCNDRLLIAAINDHLHHHIKDIDLSLDPSVLSKLVTFGIHIDEELIGNDLLLNFASSYVVEVDFQDLNNVIEYLKAIQTDIVFVLGSGNQYNYKKVLCNKIAMASLNVDDRPKVLIEERVKDKINPVVISLTSDITSIPSLFNKIIIMKNSTPVKIK